MAMESNKIYVTFIFHFFVIILSLLFYHYYYYDQKPKVALFDGFKIEFGPTQTGVIKIGILMWKIACIVFW